MKKVVIPLLICFVVISLTSLGAAQINETEKQEKISLAYSWLSDQVEEAWPVSSFDNALAILALSYDSRLADLGKSALLGKGTRCWPTPACRVKDTALALLALNKIGENTDDIEEWLMERNKTAIDVTATWYLEVDSDEATTCTISFDGADYSVSFGTDKKVKSLDTNPCFDPSTAPYEDYFLQFKSVSECFTKTYSISCDEAFIVAIPYMKANIFYVPGESWSAAADGVVDVRIESRCMQELGTCSYEGTLWGAYALLVTGNDIGMFLPYLVTYADVNDRYLPEAPLFLLTRIDEHANKLLAKQRAAGDWMASGSPYGRYYDTALALLALKQFGYGGANITKAEEWLLNNQNTDGSWGTIKVRDTAFILYTVWPKPVAPPVPPVEEFDCEAFGYICRTDCFADEEDVAYECPAGLVCCAPVAVKTCIGEGYLCCDECEFGSEHPEYDGTCRAGKVCCERCYVATCVDKGGEYCEAGQECEGGYFETSEEGPYCCIDGFCITPKKSCSELLGVYCEPKQICEGGTFKSSIEGPYCCVGGICKSKPKTWIWILITILVVGIGIFLYTQREALKRLLRPKPKPPAVPGVPGVPPKRPPLRPVAAPGIPPRMPPGVPPRMPARMPARPAARPARPVAAPARAARKEEKELAEAMRKLKKIAK